MEIHLIFFGRGCSQTDKQTNQQTDKRSPKHIVLLLAEVTFNKNSVYCSTENCLEQHLQCENIETVTLLSNLVQFKVCCGKDGQENNTAT